MQLYGEGTDTIKNSTICNVSLTKIGKVILLSDFIVWPENPTNGVAYGSMWSQEIPIWLNVFLKRTLTELPVSTKMRLTIH